MYSERSNDAATSGTRCACVCLLERVPEIDIAVSTSDVAPRPVPPQMSNSMLDPLDLQQWLEAKRSFREAAHRILSKETLVVSCAADPVQVSCLQVILKRTAGHGEAERTPLPSNDVLKAEHADAGMALLVLTLRLLHDCNGILAVSA